nr:retrovirus-related Pol polyprotein from transposon TNT 1-94 [Tanacetum cinerariifolium]
MWMRTQLQDYGFNYNKIPLYCDSQSAIAILCNPVQHSRTKHIHTQYHFIKKHVKNGIIELYFVRTEYQLVDMFTKALPEDRFKYLIRRIEHLSDTYVFTMKMEILLEPTSNKILPEWSKFVTIVKQQHKLDEVSYHKLFDILKQYQNEVNELRTEKLARNANPLALVSTAQADRDQYYQTSRSYRSSTPSPKPSIPSRSHTTTRHKGKEIAKPITPLSEIASEEDIDSEQAQRDKDMQKNLALIAKYFKKIYKPTNNKLRTSSNSKNKNVDTTLWENVGSKVVQQSGIQCFNCKEYGHFAKECRKPKRVKDSAYHKEKMLMCKQAEKGVPLQAEQYDWLANTDEEVDEQELEAHYSYMAKIQEVPIANSCTDLEPAEQVQNEAGYNVFVNNLKNSAQSKSVSNTCLVETDYSNVIHDSPDMCEDDIQNEQNDVESNDERVALTNLIANLKLDVDENKKIQKQLKKAYTTLAQELKEPSRPSLRSIRHLMTVPLTMTNLNYVKYLEKEIDELEYDKAEFSDMYDEILQDCVSKDLMCSYLQSLSDLDALDELQVNQKPNVSRPHLKSNQSKDKVLPNNSQVKVKKNQVEVHPRTLSVSNKMKSVTACKDSLYSRTLNVIVVCATCNKCLIDSNHFACVTKMLNDVYARTKKPTIVPIDIRKPKSQANKLVVTPHTKKVASKPTDQKPQSNFSVPYENTNKAWKWWIE